MPDSFHQEEESKKETGSPQERNISKLMSSLAEWRGKTGSPPSDYSQTSFQQIKTSLVSLVIVKFEAFLLPRQNNVSDRVVDSTSMYTHVEANFTTTQVYVTAGSSNVDDVAIDVISLHAHLAPFLPWQLLSCARARAHIKYLAVQLVCANMSSGQIFFMKVVRRAGHGRPVTSASFRALACKFSFFCPFSS